MVKSVFARTVVTDWKVRTLGAVIRRQLHLWTFLTAALLSAGAARAADGTWLSVNVHSAQKHLAGLSSSIRTEQLRDWALLAAYLEEEPSPDERLRGLLALEPLRFDFLAPLLRHHVGRRRALTLRGERLLVVLPEDAANVALEVGLAADEYRVRVGRPPRDAVLYRYRIQPSEPTLSIRKDAAFSSSELFSEVTGYTETEVRTLAELRTVLARNGNLVLAAQRRGALVLGTRGAGSGHPQLVEAEDVAVLQQADRNLAAQVRSQLERSGLRENYDEQVEAAFQRTLAANPGLEAREELHEGLRERIRRSTPYDEYLKGNIERAIAEWPPSLGFSLDPRMNYTAIAKSLEQAAEGNTSPFDGPYRDRFRTELRQLDTLSRGMLEDLLAKIEKLGGDQKPAASTDREVSFASLLQGSGTASQTPTSVAIPAAPTLVSAVDSTAGGSVVFGSSSVEEQIDVLLELTRRALVARADEVRRVVTALRRRDIGPLLSLQRYLNASGTGVIIAKNGPSSRIRDLQEMLSAAGQDVDIDGVLGPATRSALLRFQEERDLAPTGATDEATWKALLAGHPAKAREFQLADHFIEEMRNIHNYQCARYDGALQGTGVGMTLFYTDLVMKLWSFANLEQSPNVEGFVPQTRYPISAIHWEDVEKHPETRSWLGIRPEGFAFSEDGSAVFFAPTATRIFNASSSPFFPGKEVPANYMQERFSSWWNDHYQDVADYEPQFHRLNQLMKWAAVVKVQGYVPPALAGRLAAMQVTRTDRFDRWWKQQTNLRAHWDVDFVTLQEESTECMAIVQSEPFIVSGRLGQISGGVSLVDPRQLTRQLEVAPQRVRLQDPRFRLPGTDYTRVEDVGGVLRIPATNRGEYRVESLGRFAYELGSSERMLGDFVAARPKAVTWLAETVDSGLAVGVKSGALDLGRLTITRTTGEVRIELRQSEVSKALQLIQAAQTDGPHHEAGEWIRLNGPTWWLLKHRDGGNWISVEPKPAHGDPELSVSVGDRDLTLAPVAGTRLAERLGPSIRWEAHHLASEGLAAKIGTIPPADATSLTLQVGETRREVRLHEGALHFEVGDAPEALLTDLAKLRAALKPEDIEVVAELARDPNVLHYTRPLQDGRALQLSFGGGGGTSPPAGGSLAPPAGGGGDGFRGFAWTRESGRPPRVTAHNVLLLALDSREHRDLAGRLVTATRNKPAVVDALHKLEGVTMKDVEALETLTNDRGLTYIDFRAIPVDELQRQVLVDLTFSAEDPRVMVRKGNDVTFVGVPEASKVIAARETAQLVYDGDARFRNWTRKEFIDNTKPYAELLDKLGREIGASDFVTVENGKLNVDTFLNYVGAVAGRRFRRDVPDIQSSLRNIATIEEPQLAGAVVAITAPIPEGNGPAEQRLRAILEEIEELGVDVRTGLQSDDFDSLLADDEVTQLTVVARCQNDGLVFADTWDSFEAHFLATALADKQLLHLVTNCGVDEVVPLISGGSFRRIAVSRFEQANQASLEAALQQVTRYHAAFASPVVKWTAEDWVAAISQSGAARASLEAATTPAGSSFETSIRDLVKQLRLSPVARELGARIMSDLRRRIERKPGVTVDAAWKAANEGAAAAAVATEDRAVYQLRSVSQIKYE